MMFPSPPPSDAKSAQALTDQSFDHIHFLPNRPLRNVRVTSIFLPFQKLLLDQPIDVPLDARHLERPAVLGRLDGLGNELRMRNVLAGLEDAHDGGLGLVVAVRGHALMGLLVFGGRFFELHRVDFDAVLRVCEVRVEGEGVGGVDVTAFGVLGEGAEFGAGKRLERAVELIGGYGLLVGDAIELGWE